MWLLGGEADEEKSASSVATIEKLVTDGGGQMTSTEPWGRRTLSHPIDKNREASYFLAIFKLDSAATPALERALDADQTVLRHMLLRHDGPVPSSSDAERQTDDSRRGRRGGSR